MVRHPVSSNFARSAPDVRPESRHASPDLSLWSQHCALGPPIKGPEGIDEKHADEPSRKDGRMATFRSAIRLHQFHTRLVEVICLIGGDIPLTV